MEEADEIVTSVQGIFEQVQTEFVAAASTMESGRWTGLDMDGRSRISKSCREEVGRSDAVLFRITSIFLGQRK